MTDQMMGIIITICIPSIGFMWLIGCAIVDNETQEEKLAREKEAGKIDEFN